MIKGGILRKLMLAQEVAGEQKPQTLGLGFLALMDKCLIFHVFKKRITLIWSNVTIL